MFCYFPASLISSTFTEKNSPFSRLTKNIPNLELFRQPRQADGRSVCFYPCMMECAPKLLKIPKSECPDIWIRLPRSRYFVQLLSRFVRQLTISFHTFLDITFHIVGPRRNTQIFRAWYFFSCTRRNSRFKHGSVIVHSIFAYFALSLSAAQVYMIQERCWFSHINFCASYFPHRINILFHSSQFDVIHIHR